MDLDCYGCEYKGSACKDFCKLINVRIPAEASKVGPVTVETKEIKENDCKR